MSLFHPSSSPVPTISGLGQPCIRPCLLSPISSADRGLGRGLVPFPAAKSACAGACLEAAAAVAAVVAAVLPLLAQRNEAAVDDAAAAAAAREDIAADQIGRKDEEDHREREAAERINGTGTIWIGYFPLLMTRPHGLSLTCQEILST